MIYSRRPTKYSWSIEYYFSIPFDIVCWDFKSFYFTMFRSVELYYSIAIKSDKIILLAWMHIPSLCYISNLTRRFCSRTMKHSLHSIYMVQKWDRVKIHTLSMSQECKWNNMKESIYFVTNIFTKITSITESVEWLVSVIECLCWFHNVVFGYTPSVLRTAPP